MDSVQLSEIITRQERLAAQRLSRPVVVRALDLSQEIHRHEISVIAGVRRCGKSLYLSQIKRQFSDQFAPLMIEFDDPSLEGFSGADFPKLAELCHARSSDTSQRKLLLLDEVQNVPQWERWLTQLAKDPTLKIVVTGSNAKFLSSELATHLTGRHSTHEMMPFSFAEILKFEHSQLSTEELTLEQLQGTYQKFYTYGGFPRSYVDGDASVLPEYFTDIVERDVVVRHGSRLKKPLKELSRVLCSDNTRLMNRSRLAKTLGIKDDATVKRYCGWLEECYLFHEIKCFSPSVRKQIRSNPKYYCIDPALARYSAFSVLGDEGSFLENMVYLELKKRGYEMHYWRSSDEAAEVDFFARKAGERPQAFQVSLSVVDEATLRRELRGLALLHRELSVGELTVITQQDAAHDLVLDGITFRLRPFLEWASGDSK